MSQLKAVIFGAIGTIAETSDLQRQAFNAAFKATGLDWNWNPEVYRDLLKINGGQNRIASYRDADSTLAGVTDATIAIEDTPASIAAAKTAGIMTIATPGETTSNQNFDTADLIVPNLTNITVERLSAMLQAR